MLVMVSGKQTEVGSISGATCRHLRASASRSKLEAMVCKATKAQRNAGPLTSESLKEMHCVLYRPSASYLI